MKHTNENDERLEPPGYDEAIRAIVERKLRDQELGIEPDREKLIAESRAFVERYRGTRTGPKLTEDEIEDLISEVNPRDMSGWPLVRLDDERGEHDERRP
jgi:hypothetical protein